LTPSLVALVTALALLAPPVVQGGSPSVVVRVSRAVFSPDGDGRADAIVITVVPDRPGDLSLTIARRGDGTTIRTLVDARAISGTLKVRWRGLDDAMRRAPDGRYRAVAVLVDPGTGATARARAPLGIDTIAPRIRRSRVSPEPWTGTGGVHLSFRLSDAGPGTSFVIGFTIRDATRRRVRRVGGLERERGRVRVTWDARSDRDGPVPNGGYTFAVRATDEAGNVRAGPAVSLRLARPVSASIVGRVNDAGRRLALTFDDCGSDAAWRQILTALQRAKARATFFCVGTSVARRPSVARRTAALGMAVGNHTWSHADLRTVSGDAVMSQLQRDGAVWWRLTRETPLPYLRPPYGSYDRSVLDRAGRLGYRWIVLWDVDPRDWSGISPSAIARAVLRHAHAGSIVVLHVRATTAAALPAILRGLAARRLAPVTLTTLLRSGTPSAGWWPARSVRRRG
jgi:peptidoglycan/xylan/chitin deacetylase (PgdA/CDA1 family)